MEYQCVYLNPEFRLSHDDDVEILFEAKRSMMYIIERAFFDYTYFELSSVL